ncbi:helix-turn-helix domain-containing protein [Methylobacterium sp. ID0610]|uniref:helix-turn-helix domain-containing protein n=1 Tax=Methylobacterium carpenticola TaxID=3344827 RepID=UPI00367939DC
MPRPSKTDMEAIAASSVDEDVPLADLLRITRAQRGETQAQFAATLGVSLPALRAWEQGRATPMERLVRHALRALAREADASPRT